MGENLYNELKPFIIDPESIQVNELLRMGTFGKVKKGLLMEREIPINDKGRTSDKFQITSDVVAIKFLNCEFM